LNRPREALVHTPLSIAVQGQASLPRIERGVHSADRLWDALAALLILAGTTLFLLARSGLASIAAGTHKLPDGVTSWVQRADYFSAQSTLGIAIIVAGVGVGVWAAVRHMMRKRQQA
jgi:hypothetical protein